MSIINYLNRLIKDKPRRGDARPFTPSSLHPFTPVPFPPFPLFLLLLMITACNVDKPPTDLLQTDVTSTEKIELLEQLINDPSIENDYKARISHIDQLDSLADSFTEPLLRAKTLLKAGQYYRQTSCYEPAERVLLKAQIEAEKVKGDEGEEIMAEILLTRGQNCVEVSDYANATLFLTEAAEYFEKKNDYAKLIKVYDAQVLVYYSQVTSARPDKLQELKERENYFLNLMGELFNVLEDPVAQADCLNALVSYEINNQDYEKAKDYLSRLDSIASSCNYSEGLIACYGNGGIVAEKQGNFREGMALQYKAYETALHAGKMSVATQALANAAFDAGKLDEYELMRSYSLRGVELAREYEIKQTLWRFLDNLSNIAEQIDGNYKQALDYRNECVGVYLEIYSENNANQINQYAARFEKLRNENKINELQAEAEVYRYKSRQKNQMLFFLALTVVLSTIIILYRLRLAKQQIIQLKQEKQLVATQAVFDGETAERTRLARDLHDGLGSMLTSVKLQLQEMKREAKKEHDNVGQYDKALQMLDDTVHEMRRVSHHLMPDSLSRFGLKPAVEDFFRSLSTNINFGFFGEEKRIDPKLEVVVYRCIHELVNNALKHADASQIMVQIMQEADRIAFTVQDDGCGFDPSTVTAGAGLQNIRTRVTSFGGHIHIDAKVGEGAEINVEFSITKPNG